MPQSLSGATLSMAMAKGSVPEEKSDGGAAPADSQNRILLIEDDEIFASELASYLSAHGFLVVHKNSIERARVWMAENAPDIIVLDQFLGTTDALSLMPALREKFAGGLLILTGNTEPMDRVVGLELGADDFVSKLVSPREIVARLRSLARRNALAQVDRVAEAAEQARPKSMGGWALDTARYELLSPDGSPFHLTSAEFAILKHLHAHIGQVVSRDELSQIVLRRKFDPLDRSIDNLVSKLRKKFEGAGSSGVVKAVRSEGYVFVGFDAAHAAEGAAA